MKDKTNGSAGIRITRERGEEEADRIMAFMASTCVIAALDSSTALDAADVSAKHRLATADAIIYATARAHHVTLVTCDAHFD